MVGWGAPSTVGHPPPQSMWRHLRWLCGWPWGPGPGRQEGPCQPGHGAGDLRWLPHAAQPPQARHLQEGSTEVSWKDCGRGRDSPVPGYLQRREPHPTVGTRPIVRAWKTTALGCSYEEWVPTSCITLSQPSFPTDVTYLKSYCEG